MNKTLEQVLGMLDTASELLQQHQSLERLSHSERRVAEWLTEQLRAFAIAAGVSESSVDYMAPELKVQRVMQVLRSAHRLWSEERRQSRDVFLMCGPVEEVILIGCFAQCASCYEFKQVSEFGLRYCEEGVVRNESECVPCRAKQRAETKDRSVTDEVV